MQKLNCKIGDLAIVVNTEVLQNQGQIVEILGFQRASQPRLTGPGHVWHVQTVSGRATLCYRYKHEGGRIDKHAEGPVPDCRLRPVSGLADDGAAPADLGVLTPSTKRKRKPRAAVE